MKKTIFLAAILLSQFKLAHANSTDTSLCKPDEEILFNCQTAKKKIISLCEIKLKSPKFIEYRYGTSEKIEFSYKAESDSKNKFYQGTFHGGKISTSLIWFSNGPYTYSIFSPDWGQDGIAVVKDEKLLTSQKCSQKSPVDIGEKKFLIEDRPEDEAEKILSKIVQ